MLFQVHLYFDDVSFGKRSHTYVVDGKTALGSSLNLKILQLFLIIGE